MEFKNNYILLIGGAALLVYFFLRTGSPDWSFGLVKVTGFSAALWDAFRIAELGVAVWMIVYAIRNLRT
jgi:hypothetical protein